VPPKSFLVDFRALICHTSDVVSRTHSFADSSNRFVFGSFRDNFGELPFLNVVFVLPNTGGNCQAEQDVDRGKNVERCSTAGNRRAITTYLASNLYRAFIVAATSSINRPWTM
jgi:hypothetical protein